MIERLREYGNEYVTKSQAMWFVGILVAVYGATNTGMLKIGSWALTQHKEQFQELMKEHAATPHNGAVRAEEMRAVFSGMEKTFDAKLDGLERGVKGVDKSLEVLSARMERWMAYQEAKEQPRR